MLKVAIFAFSMLMLLSWRAMPSRENGLDAKDLQLYRARRTAIAFERCYVRVDSSSVDIGATVAVASAFMKSYSSNVRTIRSTRDVSVYRDVAPAVVLVVTNEGLHYVLKTEQIIQDLT